MPANAAKRLQSGAKAAKGSQQTMFLCSNIVVVSNASLLSYEKTPTRTISSTLLEKCRKRKVHAKVQAHDRSERL